MDYENLFIYFTYVWIG